MYFEKHSQNGLFINAIFPYIPPHIHGNRTQICKVERRFGEKAGVFSFTLSHQIKRTNKSHRIYQTSSLRGAKFRCRKTSSKSKQQRLLSSCRLRERSIIWNRTRTPIQSKKKMGHLKLFLFKQTSLTPPPLFLFRHMFGLSPVPAMLADPVFGSSEPPTVRRVIWGARGHGSREERPITPAAQHDSSLAIRFWPVVTHTITSGVWFLPLFSLSNTHTKDKEGCATDTFSIGISPGYIVCLSQAGQHIAGVGNDTQCTLSSVST